jgi:hypothetical protein
MKRLLALFAAAGLAGGMALAEPATNRVFDDYFIGFEADPAMDYGGRDIAALHSAISRTLAWAVKTDRRPYLAPAYEVFFAGGLSVVQHEVFGHGSRARESSLDPNYGFGVDFSGWTSIGKNPRNNLQNIMLCAGGTEGDSVLAHRLLRNLYTGDGADGSTVPLMALAKIDFSLYCFITPDPVSARVDFQDAYDNGNDIAAYLVSRQGQRRGVNPADVWNNDYRIDFADAQLRRNYDDLRAAAVWNLIDPAALAGLHGYVTDHALKGRTQVRPPILPLGGGFGLTAGTRAFAGPAEVTRFLDLYLVTPGPLFTVYGRDLQSSVDRTYGWGAGVYGVPLGASVTLSAAGDIWQVPESLEGLYDGSGWNAVCEVDAVVFGNWGLACKVGAKSEGFFPGTPMDSGVYGGGGLLLRF